MSVSKKPHVLHEASNGEDDWEYDFRAIARSKAQQLWTGQNDSRTDVRHHLLMSGDAPFWGGVNRHGIIVACSGVQPWFDQMISGMIADMLKAYARQSYEDDENKLPEGSDLLS